ncbi:MAG: transposase [Polyangiaceae bacterium]
MLSLALRAAEFFFYQLLLSAVDRVSRLPRDGVMPEAMRLYRENIALKAQLDVLRHQLALAKAPRRVRVGVRAAQVFAFFLNRGPDPTFRWYYLSAPLRTIERWAARFRRVLWRPVRRTGRRPLAPEIEQLIVTLKRENPAWGYRRLTQELRRMAVRVGQTTVTRVLRAHGLLPGPGRPFPFERVRASVKDALWALDFFAVRLARGAWAQVLLVMDLHTRELLCLRVHDGWDVDSRWTIRVLHEAMRGAGRAPLAVLHDHGTHFRGQFARQLRVLGIENRRSPVGMPNANAFAERAIQTVQRELLRHVRVRDAAELQPLMNDFRAYANGDRSHQALRGLTPQGFGRGESTGSVIDLPQLRRQRLVRRTYAHGILHGYSLVERDAA